MPTLDKSLPALTITGLLTRRTVMAKMKNVKLADIRRTPRKHDALPQEMMNRIKQAWDLVKDGKPAGFAALEQFEEQFLHDAHPEREIEYWMKLGPRYVEMKETIANAGMAIPDDQKHMMIMALIGASMGADAARKELLSFVEYLQSTDDEEVRYDWSRLIKK
jgi:hypothetical protein